MEMLVGVNAELCSGCQACCVACMDENDLMVEDGRRSWRRLLQVETGSYPDARISYASVSCLNCSSLNCVDICPSGALSRGEDGKTVQMTTSACTGCRLCHSGCPFGIPQYGPGGIMEKCNGCEKRVREGLSPACVRTCPTGALEKCSLRQA